VFKFKNVVLIAVTAFAISGCSNSSQAQPNATASFRWTQAQVGYLQEIYASNMAANDVFSEEIYVEIGNTMCQGFNDGKKSDELLTLLAATAQQNGLPINDRQVFGPTVLAASVAYLCPENIEKVVVQ